MQTCRVFAQTVTYMIQFTYKNKDKPTKDKITLDNGKHIQNKKTSKILLYLATPFLHRKCLFTNTR